MVNGMTDNQGRIVAVVVTHDRLAQLQVTLARLLASDPAHLAAVLVVDNASPDGTRDWLAGQGDARLHVLRMAVNGGGAGGFAAGMRHAMAHLAPDWVLVMDDDARPEPDALARFPWVARAIPTMPMPPPCDTRMATSAR